MKVITDIKQQTKNNKRVNLYLDGSFYCGLDLMTVMKYRLKTGVEISEREIIEIQYDEESSSCLNYAMSSLAKSAKTEKEIKRKLLEKGYLLEICESVILKLKEYGFLNDESYAERYCNGNIGQKGKRLIKAELKNKGVSESIAEEVTSAIDNELETAIKIAEKYVKNKDKDVKTLAKCYKYLISKGFSYDDSKSAAEAVLKLDEY